VEELYAVVGYLTPGALPELRSHLRAKYSLTDQQAGQIEGYVHPVLNTSQTGREGQHEGEREETKPRSTLAMLRDQVPQRPCPGTTCGKCLQGAWWVLDEAAERPAASLRMAPEVAWRQLTGLPLCVDQDMATGDGSLAGTPRCPQHHRLMSRSRSPSHAGGFQTTATNRPRSLKAGAPGPLEPSARSDSGQSRGCFSKQTHGRAGYLEIGAGVVIVAAAGQTILNTAGMRSGWITSIVSVSAPLMEPEDRTVD
jgi:hypothetical protein